MKKHLLTLLMTIASLCLSAQERFVGGDLSLLPLYEQAGDQWLDENGKTIDDLIGYVHDKGWNTVRVRLFVDPSRNADPSTPQDLDYVTALAKRIKQSGMALMLDLHYSDTWADPSTQRIPAAWAKMTDEELAQQLFIYTKNVLQHLATEGVTPDFVQTGNEITYGLLWRTPDGHYPASKSDYAAAGYCPTWSADYAEGKQQWERTANLLKQATRAVREKAPAAKIIIHTELGALTTNSDHFYTHLRTAGFTDYDIIGLSYYPFWHGRMESLTPLMAQFKKDFPDKTVQIVETAWNNSYYPDDATYSIEALGGKWQADAAGQVAYLKDLARTLHRSDNVNGIMYWTPEECGFGHSQKVLDHWYNRGMWKSSTDQKHSLLRASDGTSPVEALALFLQDSIPEDTIGGDIKPGAFTDDQGIRYALYDNYTAGVENGASAFGTVLIPDSITVDGKVYYVTSILSNAFFDNKALESVTIGRNISGIWGSAFNGCNALKKVHFPDGSALQTIDTWAFASTPVDSLTIPSGVTVIREGAFSNCWALRYLCLTGDIQEIQQFAFAGWTDDSTPTASQNWSPFTDGVFIYSMEPPMISPKAFCAEDLKSATLYVRQQNITATAFASLGFAKIEPIAGTADIYHMVDGVTYRFNAEDKTATVEGLATTAQYASEITIHAQVIGDDGSLYDVEGIKPWAFHQCHNLQEVTIEDGISVIPEGCFAECANLRKVEVLSTEYISIGAFAFCRWDETTTQSGCPALQAVLLHAALDDYSPQAFHSADIGASTILFVPSDALDEIKSQNLGFRDVLSLDAYATGIHTSGSLPSPSVRKYLNGNHIEIQAGDSTYSTDAVRIIR